MDYGHWAQNALNHFHLLSVSIVVNLSINGCGYDSSFNKKVHAIFLFGQKSSKSITDLFFLVNRPKPAQNRHTKTETAQKFEFLYFGALPKTETAQKIKNRPMFRPNRNYPLCICQSEFTENFYIKIPL